MDGVDFAHHSEDNTRQVVEQMVLYEYTHTNEDGVRQYRVVGVTSWTHEAEDFLAMKPAGYMRVQQVRDMRQ